MLWGSEAAAAAEWSAAHWARRPRRWSSWQRCAPAVPQPPLPLCPIAPFARCNAIYRSQHCSEANHTLQRGQRAAARSLPRRGCAARVSRTAEPCVPGIRHHLQLPCLAAAARHRSWALASPARPSRSILSVKCTQANPSARADALFEVLSLAQAHDYALYALSSPPVITQLQRYSYDILL